MPLINMKQKQYAILILEKEKKTIERNIRDNKLMQSNMRKATQELSKITELKKAIKVLKIKNRLR